MEADGSLWKLHGTVFEVSRPRIRLPLSFLPQASAPSKQTRSQRQFSLKVGQLSWCLRIRSVLNGFKSLFFKPFSQKSKLSPEGWRHCALALKLGLSGRNAHLFLPLASTKAPQSRLLGFAYSSKSLDLSMFSERNLRFCICSICFSWSPIWSVALLFHLEYNMWYFLITRS